MSGSTPSELALHLAALRPVLEDAGVPHALIGGAAVMTYGLRARTRDLDFLISGGPPALAQVSASATRHGWRAETKSAWHLRVWDGRFFSDIIAGETALEQDAVQSATVRLLGDQAVPTINATHLCALKILAGRPRDLRDVGELKDAWDDLRISDVNRLLAPFGIAWEHQQGEVVPTIVALAAADEENSDATSVDEDTLT